MSTEELIVQILVVNLLRYLVAAGLAYALFYVIFRKRWAHWKIQSKFPKPREYSREIAYSLLTISIFVSIGFLIVGTQVKQHTLIYEDISARGWTYWGVSIFLMILLHDTYFYWMHRLMHLPKIYKKVHLVHHQSMNPSPWAAYSFHPIEAVVEASVIFPIVFLIPVHQSALMTFLLFMIFYNVYGHLGYELYPKGFNKTFIGKWINTSVNHNQHHKHFHGNYGLYFLFWDRLLGTLRADYDQAYLNNDEKKNSKK